MGNEFESVCDDFYVNLRVGTQLGLPQQRETLIHFFEQIQKSFPDMTRFRRSEQTELTLEEDRERDSYRWLSVDAARLACGHVNPESIQDALKLHHTVLDHAPHALGLSMVEIDHMDVVFGFDLEFAGNHDEVIAESLMADSPLSGLLDEAGAKAVDVQPSITVSLSDDQRLQARIDVVTRSAGQPGRASEFGPEAISVFLVLRRYWGDRGREPVEELLNSMSARAEVLAQSFVVPKIIVPIRSAIATRS
ncbi:MAG: hypothetical protein JWM57_2358 [Phycisphaerales bacterium]|nr:hypothetical protein [Phycisphaerales bacterium]